MVVLKKEGKKSMSRIRRVPTGIPGFDGLIEGGFPENSSILLAGGPGTGKTIFSMEYLVKGANDYNEKGLYVTFEQSVEDLKKQALQFGWNLDSLQKKGLLEIVSITIKNINANTIKGIKNIVKVKKIKRVVIDSLSTLIINAPIYVNPQELSVKEVVGSDTYFSPPIIGDYIVKRFVYTFIQELKDLKSTNILIGEASQTGEAVTRDTLSEFASDGIILITFEALGGEYSRSLIVSKMRRTKNNEDVHSVEIGKKGIIVHDIS